MATPENAQTEKDATSTPSRESKLRSNAPRLRTAKALVEKHEQIFDALEREAITGKIAEQMGQQLKGILSIAAMEMRYWQLAAHFKRKAPVPRGELLRSLIGLPAEVQPTDGEFVRRGVEG